MKQNKHMITNICIEVDGKKYFPLEAVMVRVQPEREYLRDTLGKPEWYIHNDPPKTVLTFDGNIIEELLEKYPELVFLRE